MSIYDIVENMKALIIILFLLPSCSFLKTIAENPIVDEIAVDAAEAIIAHEIPPKI